jgi:hypothetical protein
MLQQSVKQQFAEMTIGQWSKGTFTSAFESSLKWDSIVCGVSSISYSETIFLVMCDPSMNEMWAT